MQCQLCNKKLGEWQCTRCARIVCSRCIRTKNGNPVCAACATSSLRSVLVTVFILFVAVVVIFFIMKSFAGEIPLFGPIPIIEAFSALGFFIVLGVGIIFMLILIVYLILRYFYKPKIQE